LEEKGTDYIKSYLWLESEKERAIWMKNVENLLEYLNNFLEIDVDQIKKLSSTLHFTLKQFLYDDYLYSKKIVENLKGTPYEAVNKNVKENLESLKNLKLIQTTKVSNIPPDARKRKYYKLTTVRLFYVLKEIGFRDIFVPSDVTKNVKIFKVYKDDLLFTIFIYNIIGRNLLYDITNEKILWEIVKHLNQVCREINKNLKSFKELQKNNRIKMSQPITWKFNLKDNPNEWMNFCNSLLDIIKFQGELQESMNSVHKAMSIKSKINYFILYYMCSIKVSS